MWVNRKKIREIKFENYRRSKFGPCCLLAQGAYLYISLHYTENKFKSEALIICCIFPIHGDIAKDCALLGGNGNTWKIKTTAKLNSKKPPSPRSVTYTECMPPFLTPLGSHYRLPLRRWKRLCSSLDGLHWGTVKNTCRQDSLSHGSIDTNFDPPQMPLDSRMFIYICYFTLGVVFLYLGIGVAFYNASSFLYLHPLTLDWTSCMIVLYCCSIFFSNGCYGISLVWRLARAVTQVWS